MNTDQNNQTSPVLLSFGLFADLHYADKIYSGRHCAESGDKLRVCIDDFNSRELALAVCLGDVIDHVGVREEELQNLATMREEIARFRGDVHVLMGNHDLDALPKDEFLQNCGTVRPERFYSFDMDAVHFVVLDGNYLEDGTEYEPGNFMWDGAWLSADQITWLEDDLKAHSSGPVIVFCHQNIDERFWGTDRDGHCLCNAADVRPVLERAGNVSAVFQGHSHGGHYENQKGVTYVTLRAMVEGPGLENNAYAIASLHEDRSLTVEGFGQQESCVITPG